jgi:hypothetical protein
MRARLSLLPAVLLLGACAAPPEAPVDPIVAVPGLAPPVASVRDPVAAPAAPGPVPAVWAMGTPVSSPQGRTAVLMDARAGTLSRDAPPVLCADMFGNERRC